MDELLKSTIALEAQKTPGQRLAEALELMDWGTRMQRSRLAADHPGASEEQIEAMLTAWRCNDAR